MAWPKYENIVMKHLCKNKVLLFSKSRVKITKSLSDFQSLATHGEHGCGIPEKGGTCQVFCIQPSPQSQEVQKPPPLPHVSSLQEKATLSPEYSSVHLQQNEWSRLTHHNLTYSLNMQSLLPN